MNEVIFTLVFYVGCWTIGALIGVGIVRLVTLIIDKVRKAKGKEPVERFHNTWIAGWKAREESLNHYRSMLADERKRSEMYFEKYLDAAFPHRIEQRNQERAEVQAKYPVIEPTHAQAQIDTDE